VAVEPNRSFADLLWHENSRMKVMQDFAENTTDKILELYGPADFIAAGLPYSMMSDDSIRRIIEGSHALLATDGELRMFFYAHSLVLPKIQRMLDYVLDNFQVTWTSVSWNNVPPMAIIRCLT
jgi:phospholipid N-methyltransferase